MAIANFLHEQFQFSLWASWAITGGVFLLGWRGPRDHELHPARTIQSTPRQDLQRSSGESVVANDQLTVADKSPEEIQHEMSRHSRCPDRKGRGPRESGCRYRPDGRRHLTDTVESVKSIITTAPGAVGDSVKQAAAAVSETMKKTFDISCHVREHPWTAMGVSTLCRLHHGMARFESDRRGAIPQASVHGHPFNGVLARSPIEARRLR